MARIDVVPEQLQAFGAMAAGLSETSSSFLLERLNRPASESIRVNEVEFV